MPGSTLVIGYGSLLRRDDALGPCIAEHFAKEYPDAAVLLVPLLCPELAEPVAAVDLAIFVDAREADGELGVMSQELEPAPSSAPWLGHISDPRAILALARAVYGRCPRAFLLTAPLTESDVGFGLSEAAEELVPQAIRALVRLIEGARS